MVQSEGLSENQKAALLKLLTDDDIAVYHTIRGKILSYGQSAGDWLRPHTLSSDPVLRRRAHELVQYLAKQEADNNFLAFCLNQGEDLDVEEGAWLLSQTQYPDINIAAYQALFDSYVGDLRERIDFGSTPERILATINQYLFTELSFVGNETNYYDPDNSYLNRVVDRRTGNPISLCLVYLFVARRLRLPIVGIGMPGHFLIRFQSSTGEVFIDAFNRGKLLTKADCVKYLLHTSHGFQEGYLSPVSPRRILLRVCSNLHQIYVQLELPDETARLQRYIVALAK
jgi:regulator of sirC expression with transglutaminase-like and TPR domain